MDATPTTALGSLSKAQNDCFGIVLDIDQSCDGLQSSLQQTPVHYKESLPSNELKLDPSNFLQLPAENRRSRSSDDSSLGDSRSRSTISVFSVSEVSSRAVEGKDLNLLVLIMGILLVVIFIFLFRPFFLYQQDSKVGLYLRIWFFYAFDQYLIRVEIKIIVQLITHFNRMRKEREILHERVGSGAAT